MELSTVPHTATAPAPARPTKAEKGAACFGRLKSVHGYNEQILQQLKTCCSDSVVTFNAKAARYLCGGRALTYFIWKGDLAGWLWGCEQGQVPLDGTVGHGWHQSCPRRAGAPQAPGAARPPPVPRSGPGQSPRARGSQRQHIPSPQKTPHGYYIMGAIYFNLPYSGFV